MKKIASYTMQLRVYIEAFSQYIPNLSRKERIEIGRKQLFDFDYEFFDEDKRKSFETNIINFFYMSEIGFETEELFKHYFENWFHVNMGYWNQMFLSELIEYDPLESYSLKTDWDRNLNHDSTQDRNIDNVGNVKNTNDEDKNRNTTLKEETKVIGDSVTNSTKKQTGSENQKTNEKTDNTSDTTNKNKSFDRNISSDTPDSRLQLTANSDGTGGLNYASQIQENTKNDDGSVKVKDNTTNSGTNDTNSKVDVTGKEDNKTTSTGNVSNTQNDKETNKITTNEDSVNNQKELEKNKANDIEKFYEFKRGSIGVMTYPDMIQKYRDSFLRIEAEIHKELQQFFMIIY